MCCRRLKYENTFLVVKDEMNFQGRGRSLPPRLTRQDMDLEIDQYVRSHEAAKNYVSLLEADVSNPGLMSTLGMPNHGAKPGDSSMKDLREMDSSQNRLKLEETQKPKIPLELSGHVPCLCDEEVK